MKIFHKSHTFHGITTVVFCHAIQNRHATVSNQTTGSIKWFVSQGRTTRIAKYVFILFLLISV